MIVYFFLGVILTIIVLLDFLNNTIIVKITPMILPLILTVALFTLLERRVLASIQRRRGPNVVGIFGILQPFADAIKLIFKESIIPGLSNIVLFLFSPIFTFSLSLLNWSVIPINYNIVLSDINLGVMFLFAISSLGVYGIIISGWSSNSKYAFLGSLRSVAQFISYEVSIGIIIMTILISVNSLNLTSIVMFQDKIWFILPFWPSFFMFFIAALAETNRIPFDLPEAESELVSGYNVEYSAITFVLFFLAEYSNILIMSTLISIFFFAGWISVFNINFINGWFWISLKICFIIFIFIIIRATLPRYRYDQLMNVGWKVLLPISLSYFFFISTIFFL
jgi:NADH-quinone oxidoreductase subunit H